jgi:antitoxin component YwqK of YwqJK toxin-antitoxin module
MITSSTKCFPDGNIKYLIYYKDGLQHNDNGPSCIEYYINGVIKRKIYRLNGMLHREDGPAIIYYNKDETVSDNEYWLHNKKLTIQDWYSRLSEEQKINFVYGIYDD